MYSCIYGYMCTGIFVKMHICVHVNCIYAYMCKCIYGYMDFCKCMIFLFLCICTYAYMDRGIYANMCRCIFVLMITYGYMDICICIYIYTGIYICVELPVFGLRQGGREGGWCTARCSNFRNKSAGSVFFEENQSGSSRDPVGIQSGSSRAKILEFLAPCLDLKITQKKKVLSLIPHLLPKPTLAPIFLFRSPAVHQYPPLLHQKCRMYMFIYIYVDESIRGVDVGG